MSDPKYLPHPYTEIFPPMTEEERQELEQRIKIFGLREPIDLDSQNRIIDGLNRYRACIALDMELKPENFRVRHDLKTDDDILEFMRDRNFTRRHLSTSQKMAIAADFTDLKRGRRKSGNSQISVAEAAKMAGIDSSSVNIGKAVKRASPELHAAMKADAISGNAAEKIIKLPQAERDKEIEQVTSSLQTRGAKETRTRARTRAASASQRTAKAKLSMPNIEGPWNTIVAAYDALQVLAQTMRNIGTLLDEKRPPVEVAKRVKACITARRKLDASDLDAAEEIALREINKVIRAAIKASKADEADGEAEGETDSAAKLTAEILETSRRIGA